MVRFVFLDVDGVLVTRRGLLLDFEENDPTLIFDSADHILFPIERSCLAALAAVLQEFDDCRVVVSSTWRLDPPSKSFLTRAFSEFGLASYLVGDTPNLPGFGRGTEILRWLETHAINSQNFVVIDDEHTNDFIRVGIGQRVVQTSIETGFTEVNAVQAIGLLGNGD
eukprot:c29324_g1_i1.p1 GENE.c29324_g1_i1~~c29324_g1_i1.p1  ORF type:complete len:167 (-),score=27.86 c29324_g1_i1:71-571(-)